MKFTTFPDISLGSGTSSSTLCRISPGVYSQGFLTNHILIYPQLIQCCSKKWVCWTRFMISACSCFICVNSSGSVNILRGEFDTVSEMFHFTIFLLVHCSFTIRSRLAQDAFTICSLFFHHWFMHSPVIHCWFTICSLFLHHWFSMHSPIVHCWFTTCSLFLHH
jgi:hypothetical protein